MLDEKSPSRIPIPCGPSGWQLLSSPSEMMLHWIVMSVVGVLDADGQMDMFSSTPQLADTWSRTMFFQGPLMIWNPSRLPQAVPVLPSPGRLRR
jgi:hypothetical protein